MSKDSSSLVSSQYSFINYGPVKAVLYALGAFFGSQLVATVLFVAPLLLLGKEVSDSAFEGDVSRTVFSGLVGFSAIYIAYKLLGWSKTKLSDVGLKNYNFKAIGTAFLSFGAYFLTLIAVLTLVRSLLPGFDLGQEQQIGFTAADGTVLLFISLVVIAPITEEILMRGVLFSGLRTKLNFVYSVVVTSIVFAAAHLPAAAEGLHWPAAIDTFVLSVFLCYLREKTDSLLAPILLHALKNFLALLFLIGVLA